MNKKISFFTAKDIENMSPEDYLKQIIPGLDTSDLEVQFSPINTKKRYGMEGIGNLFKNIVFQLNLLGGQDSNYQIPAQDDVLYALTFDRKNKNNFFTEKLGIVKKGDNFVLTNFGINVVREKDKNGKVILDAKGKAKIKAINYNSMNNIGVIPNNNSSKRVIFDLNNNVKTLQSVTDIQNGVAVTANASYSEIGSLIKRMVSNLGYENRNSYSYYEDVLKTILKKNLGNIEHNNQITIGNLFSHKNTGGITEGYDSSSKNLLISKDQFNKLALFNSRTEEELEKGMKWGIYGAKWDQEVKMAKGTDNVSFFENNIKFNLRGEDVKYYRFNIDEGKDYIRSITAIAESGQEFEFKNFSTGDNNQLFSGIQYIREGISTDSSNLYHTIPGENKNEIRELITNAQKTVNEKGVKNKNKLAKNEAEIISNIMKKRYAEAHGVDLETFIKMGGEKELSQIKTDEIEAMILSGRNFDYGHNIAKQSQNTKGGAKRLQGSYAHPLAFLNKEGQRKAQSIDQLSSVNLKVGEEEIFDVGREINKIGENIEQLKYKKIEVQSAQLNAIDKLVKQEYGEHISGTSVGITNRRAFVLYTNSDFGFQDSNVVSTQVAMAGAGTSDVNRINVDYSSLNLNKNGDIFSNEEISKIAKMEKLNNENILKDGTIENKIIRNLLGEDNYQKYVSKNEYVNEIKGLKNLMPENLDLNVAEDRKAYVKAMDLITQRYNEINEKYLIKGDELGKATIISDNIVNDGQLKTMTKSNFALIDDINLNKNGIEIKTKNVSLAGEGAKMMTGMVKLTVQNTNHLMGIMNGESFMPIEMIVNDKTTSKKRSFTGSFITSFLQTAYTHADTYGNKDLNDFDKYLRTNGNITYNGKTANVLDILNIGFEKNNGVMTINDKTMTKLLQNKNIFDKNALPYEEYLKMIAENIEANIGKVTDKDSVVLGSLISGKIEEVYGNYIKQFGKDKSNMQIVYENADIYTSNLNLTEDGVGKVNNVGKAYRFINNFVKMNESISRKDEAGLKFGRLSNFVLDEQHQSGLVELIEEKIVDETQNKISKVIGLTAFPGTEFERSGEVYKSTFGSNSINISNLDSSVRNVNLPLNEYMEKSPIAKKIMKIGNDGELLNESFGSLTGFDSNTSRKFKNFFDNREKAKEILLGTYYKTLVGNHWEKDKYVSVVGGFGEILKDDEGNVIGKSKIDNAIKEQLKANLKLLKLTDEQIEKVAGNTENFNMYKTLYAMEAMMKIEDPKNITQAQYDFLTNITSDKNSLQHKTINTFADNLEKMIKRMTESKEVGKNQDLDIDIMSSAKHFLKNSKMFFGENIFSMLDIKETFVNDSLPFFIDDLAVDAQGVIVYNKELANVERIAQQNHELIEINRKKDIYKKLLKPLEEIENIRNNNGTLDMNKYNYKDLLTKTFEGLSDKEKKEFFKDLNITLDTNKFRNSFEEGGTLALKGINKNGKTQISKDTMRIIKMNAVKADSPYEILERLKFTLNDMSGKKEYSNIYMNLKNDYDIVKNVLDKFVNEKIENATEAEADAWIVNRFESNDETKEIKLNVLKTVRDKIDSLEKSGKTYEENLVKSIFNRTGDSAEILFKNKGYMYNAPTTRFKNAFALSPREGTGIIDYIANEAEQFMGKGYYDKKYSSWSLDNKHGAEMQTKFKEFRKALTLLYGEHYASDITQDMLNSNGEYTREILSKRLNKLSGIAIGTKAQFEKLGMAKFFGKENFTYQMLARNPHQYISSLRGTRFVMLDEKNQNLSFFGSYYGNQAKIKGMQNNLLFVGKRTAMASHGDFDGDVFQALFLSSSDFGKVDKALDKKLKIKMEYMNILADISERDIKSEIKSGKPLKGDLKRLLTLARQEQGLSNSSTDLEVFESIKNAYYVNKAEHIRTTTELEGELKSHKLIPELKKAFAEIDGEKIEFDKTKISKIIGKMSAEEKLSLFLGNADDDMLKNIDDYIDGSPEIKNYINKYLNAKTDASKSEAFLNLLGELNSSKDNISWNNASLAKSSYADYTGINRTGIVHSRLSTYRESATVVLHEDLFNEKHKIQIKGINENLRKVIKDTIGLGSISEYIEGIGISAKLGGKTNPYEVLKSFEKIKVKLMEGVLKDLVSSDKTIALNQILKDNMNVKLKDISELQPLLKKGLTSEGILKQMTGGNGIGKDLINTFVKLIDLDGEGQDLSEYTGLEVSRGISNFIAIYSNAILDKENGTDAINGFKEIVNKDKGNLLARMQRIGSKEGIVNNLGQNFRVVKEAYHKVVENSQNFINKFNSRKINEGEVEELQKIENTVENMIEKHTSQASKLNETIEEIDDENTIYVKGYERKNKDGTTTVVKGYRRKKTNADSADIASLEKIETEYKKHIDELKKLIDSKKDKEFSSEELKQVTDKLEQEIKRLKDIINSKTDHIKNLESQFTSAKSSYQENLNSTIKQMQNLKESIKIASENKKARFIDSGFADNLEGVKKFASNNKLAFTVGAGMAVLGMFLKIFQSNRSVVKLNINEEEYQNEKMPLQRQFGNYEINTNIRSFYR